MKSYLVEVELTKTVRQRTRVVVTTQSSLLDGDAIFEIENEADRAVRKGGDSVAWTDVPGTEHLGGNPKYTISPVTISPVTPHPPYYLPSPFSSTPDEQCNDEQ